MSARMKRPAFQFYPGDWQRDAALRACSIAARGLWIECLCHMHDGEPYGHLRVGGSPVTDAQLARMVGESPALVRKLLAELESAGVFGRAEDGAIYSRRMVRDEALRTTRAACGSLGGNPALTKKDKSEVKPLVNQTANQTPTPAVAVATAEEQVNDKSLKAPDGAESADAGATTPDASAAPASRRSASAARTPKPKGEPALWMAELRPVWFAQYGGAMPKGAATTLGPLVTTHGVEAVLAHLGEYVAQTPAQFASVPKFAQTFGAYAPGGAVASSKPAQSAIPQLAATASADDVTTRREAQALYETLRRLELPHDANRAGGMFKAAVDRGTLPRAVAVAVFRAVYGWDGIPPDDGGALRGALREGRAGDAVRSLEAIVREAASARSEAA